MNNPLKRRKIILFLFTLKLLTIYYFFRSRSAEDDTETPISSSLKRWPSLPSFRPWLPTPDVPVGSCEGYFGNGFTQQITVLEESSAGWFRCFYSATLQTSVCEGGGLRMDPGKISMSKGGEPLESVMGRKEDDELPVFHDGAFEIGVSDGSRAGRNLVNEEFLNRYLPRGSVNRHTVRALMASTRLVDAIKFQCSEWVEEPTLLVTRFEYANLFHTLTDWYSAYVASRVVGLPRRPHVVFVDGHCQSALDEMWRALFSSLRFAKSFAGPVCFRHAILVPLGYQTAMFEGLDGRIDCSGVASNETEQHPNTRKTTRLSEFGEMMRAAVGLPPNEHRSSWTSGHTILFIRRENYVAHPRATGKVESRFSNEKQIFTSLKSWAANYSGCKLNVVNGLFAHMHMEDQIEIIQHSTIIVSAHGAGLSHIISALPNTSVLEILSPSYRRPHFALIAKWKGLNYHPLYLNSSYAHPVTVIKALDDIVKGLGC